MKRWLESQHSGKIEIIEEGGMLSLNTAKVCYSGRTLYEAFYPSLKQQDWRELTRICLLGLGGGTVVKMLRDDLSYRGWIDAVDFDPQIIEVSRELFGLALETDMAIYAEDAQHFLHQVSEPYEVIICDLFIHDRMPEFMEQIEFWKHAMNALTPQGKIIVNAFAQKRRVMNMCALAEEAGLYMHRPTLVNGTNLMMLGEKRVKA
jgi:spermidine synthase